MSLFQNIFWGMLFPLGFAPFHHSSLLYISLLGFFYQLHRSNKPFIDGFLFGTGLSIIGLSWVYVSIHAYGHIPVILALIITIIFIFYISLFYGAFAFLSKFLADAKKWRFPWLLAASWCMLEYLRSHLFGGFPWLILGFSAYNTSLQNLLPWFGIYAPSFAICLAIALFAHMLFQHKNHVISSLIAVTIFLIPSQLNICQEKKHTSIPVAIIQGNVSIHDKWNEEYFWKQLNTYYHDIIKLTQPQRLIVLPEAAISIPRSYVSNELKSLNTYAKALNASLLIGIPEATSTDHSSFYNALIGLGNAKGTYYKQQLVLFGEEIPKFWQPIFKILNIPVVTTIAGSQHQTPIYIFKHPIASLICYEIAYPEILRHQLPKSEWIVSISDDAWFGHSFAMYQHLEMAQTLSFMSQRWQLFVNNNGLSSLIDKNGIIKKQLPTWKASKLTGMIDTSSVLVPWIHWGDKPIIFLCISLLLMAIFMKLTQKIKLPKSSTLITE